MKWDGLKILDIDLHDARVRETGERVQNVSQPVSLLQYFVSLMA